MLSAWKPWGGCSLHRKSNVTRVRRHTGHWLLCERGGCQAGVFAQCGSGECWLKPSFQGSYPPVPVTALCVNLGKLLEFSEPYSHLLNGGSWWCLPQRVVNSEHSDSMSKADSIWPCVIVSVRDSKGQDGGAGKDSCGLAFPRPLPDLSILGPVFPVLL